MRKVLFTKPLESGVNQDGTGWEYDYVKMENKPCEVFEGHLHCITTTGLPVDELIWIYPVAIVEDTDGYLHELKLSNIKMKFPV